MNRNVAIICASIILVGVLSACHNEIDSTFLTPTNNLETDNEINCPIPPDTFNETDLIGTWVANYSYTDEDVLIIKQDGTYKQLYSSPSALIKYESDWQQWRAENRESGYIRLYLDGMKRCDGVISMCLREGGGIDPELIWAIDYCEDTTLDMPDGVVLIVTGSNKDVPRGIILRQTRLAGSNWTWSFHLQEENDNP